MADQFRAHEKDWENVLSEARIGGYMSRCVLELRHRVAALEAMAKTAAMVVPKTGPALLLPDDAFQAMEAAAAKRTWAATRATTADGLSPVEPAPQAPHWVTVEELACIMREMPDTGYKGEAAWLLNHPRIGPLLRGEGAPAPVRVVLPEEPPELPRLRRRGLPRWILRRLGRRSRRGRAPAGGGQADD